MTVTSSNGKAVNLRAEPSTSAKVLCTVPNGVDIDLLTRLDETWYKIRYKGIEGYMMRKYITEPHDPTTTPINLPELEEIYKHLDKALTLLKKLMNRS